MFSMLYTWSGRSDAHALNKSDFVTSDERAALLGLGCEGSASAKVVLESKHIKGISCDLGLNL